jgi:glycosyltransferase involved in cell wall biosynthesis
MRVWLVNHYALPPSEPGGTRHYALARELMRNGHDVTIIASSFSHATKLQLSCTQGRWCSEQELGGVPFLFLRVPGHGGNVARLWNMFVFAFQLWLGVGTRRLRKPDVIVGSSLTLFAALAAQRLARRMSVPFVLEIRDLWPQTLIDMGMNTTHPAVILFGIIERYLYRHADEIVTLLPNASEHMSSKGARPDKITWIPNGVDLQMIPLVPPSDAAHDDVFTVMYAGSHGLSDALESVLDAASILDKEARGRFRFRFVGEGPNKAALRRRVEAEHIGNVVFEEPVPKLQLLSSLLPQADAFIITAKKTDLYRYGISPNKLHEYMAAARPTIIAANSSNNPVAEAAAGITVAPEDPREIAEAIKMLAAMSAEERWSMGMRGRLYVQEHYDFAVLALRFEQVLKSAVLTKPKQKEAAADVKQTAA